MIQNRGSAEAAHRALDLRAILLCVLAAIPVAALWTVALWDRTSLAGMSSRWAGTAMVALAAIVWWCTGRADAPGRLAAAGLLPAALLSTGVVVAVYLSDAAHHAFLFDPFWRGLAVPLSLALTFAAPILAEALAEARETGRPFAALADVLSRHQRLVVAGTLGATGVVLAGGFRGVATDDLIRYWSVADALAQGAGYPVTTGAAGSGGFYLLDLPLYPALLLASFAMAGHRYLALELPLVAAHAALPFLLYGLARTAGAGRLTALWLTLALLCLPYYQVYALGAPEPEPLLAVALTLALWLGLLAGSHTGGPFGEWAVVPGRGRSGFAPTGGRSLVCWAGTGLATAAAVLTRPEGALYAAPLLLGLLWCSRAPLVESVRRRRLSRPAAGFLVCAALAVLPVAAFSAFLLTHFRILWPAGWTNVAGPQFAPANVRLALQQNLPFYAAVAGLPAPSVGGPLLALAAAGLAAYGFVLAWRQWPLLRWVPLAGALDLAVVFVSPTYLTPDLFSPATFFRHLSILFPWLVPPLALALDAIGRQAQRVRLARGLLTLLAMCALAFELGVLGGTAARTLAGQRTVLTSDPYVLLPDLARREPPGWDALPLLPFTLEEGAGGRRVTSIDPRFDYMAFRGRLFGAMHPYDLHVNPAGRGFMLAAGVFALLGVLALAAAKPRT